MPWEPSPPIKLPGPTSIDVGPFVTTVSPFDGHTIRPYDWVGNHLSQLLETVILSVVVFVIVYRAGRIR